MTKADIFSETVNNRLVKLELLGSSLNRKIQAFTSLSIVPLSDCAGGSTVVGFHSVTTRVPDLFRLLIKAGQADV
ncbi:hypothetical protein PchlO6_3225 [Pseudomonas chlororaphis O6]|uniref:Uncharacterized protein n=1 Tax=Pseudomonas chlororaphis O6 TaxID=1037915 RepID=A0AB33WP54_9PSED|nr:hypothetical protein PchlO6_3225 [Pseudomonas chlororaphis O6]QHC89729.1 hypothetical protein PchlR47_15840 [Pseudomonas chlororaphis]